MGIAQGSLFIISAPSGTGKTSLVTALCSKLKNIKKSISHTTRAMRPGEQDGVHYNFVSMQQFEQELAQHVFLEHAQVFGNYYGTSQQLVTQTLSTGTDLILEIDWQGAQQIRAKMPDVVSIFILPPGPDALRQRLTTRNQDQEHNIQLRLNEAKIEVGHYTEYDYLVINDDFETALQQLLAIVIAARQRVSHQQQLWQDLLDKFNKTA